MTSERPPSLQTRANLDGLVFTVRGSQPGIAERLGTSMDALVGTPNLLGLTVAASAILWMFGAPHLLTASPWALMFGGLYLAESQTRYDAATEISLTQRVLTVGVGDTATRVELMRVSRVRQIEGPTLVVQHDQGELLIHMDGEHEDTSEWIRATIERAAKTAREQRGSVTDVPNRLTELR